MPAASQFEILHISADFSPLQIQPKSIALWGMEGFARWTREHAGSWQRMLHEDKIGVVVAYVEITYQESHHFGDAAELQVYPRLFCNERGSVIYEICEICAGDKPVATFDMVLIPVRVADEESLIASRARLEGALLQKCGADDDDLPYLRERENKKRLKERLPQIVDDSESLGEHLHTFTLFRHRCEVADQWLYTEVPAIVSEGREGLALSSGAPANVRAGVSQPLRRVEYELYRPFYSFERGQVETTALDHQGQRLFVHRLLSPETKQLHGCAIEYF